MDQVDSSSKNDVRPEAGANASQQGRPSVSAAAAAAAATAAGSRRSVVYLQAPEIMNLMRQQGSHGRNSSPDSPENIPVLRVNEQQRNFQTPSPLTLRMQQYYRRMSNNAEPEGMGVVEVIATLASLILLVCTLPFSLCFAFKVVQEYERAVIFRLGRLRTGGARGPGIFFVLPCVDTYCKVDLRTVSFDVAPQEVLTKDSVTVTVDAVIYYRVQEPLNAVVKVNNYSHSTRLLAATTLRNVLGTRNLSEILSDREAIAHMMQTALDDATDPWGVKVERVEIKDVRLPVQLQRAMAAEAEAAREARAKVIAAEGEMKASRALKEASDVMAESPAALQLRYLQTLNSISAEKNSTIIFPLPLDILTPFLRPNHQYYRGPQPQYAPPPHHAPPAQHAPPEQPAQPVPPAPSAPLSPQPQ